MACWLLSGFGAKADVFLTGEDGILGEPGADPDGLRGTSTLPAPSLEEPPAQQQLFLRASVPDSRRLTRPFAACCSACFAVSMWRRMARVRAVNASSTFTFAFALVSTKQMPSSAANASPLSLLTTCAKCK